MSYLSLFCGCGGLDYGFDRLGMVCEGAYDIDSNAVDTYNNNYTSIAERKDLSDASFSVAGLKKVDLVISGSPCQGFSTLGRREFDDPRNHLLIRAVEIALKYNAKYFVAENVPGALSGKHGEWWSLANDMLREKGFSTRTLVLNANDYGVPQTRKRVFLVAVHGVSEDIFDRVKLPRKTKEVTVGDALNTLNVPIDTETLSGRDLLIAERIAQGQKLCDVRGGNASVHTWEIPEVYGEVDERDILILNELMRARRAKKNRVRESGDGDYVSHKVLEQALKFKVKRRLENLEKKGYVKFDSSFKVNLSHTFNGKYRRLSRNGFSPTVDTNFGNPRYFLHPTEDRGLLPTEAAALQGFPKKYKFTGSDTQKMRLIGNAVPPKLSKVVANYLSDIVKVK